MEKFVKYDLLFEVVIFSLDGGDPCQQLLVLELLQKLFVLLVIVVSRFSIVAVVFN